MFGSHIIEMAIGMALFFLTVSLMCSAIREGLETVMKTRALNLERGIRELLDDPSGENMVRSVFQHAQVFPLFGGDYDPSIFHQGWSRLWKGPRHLRDYWQARKALPTYIPAKQFASAIMDIALRGPGTWPYPVAAQPMSVTALRERAAYLPSARLQRAVLGAIDQAEGDLQKTRANLESWFDASMDRVSGWYKRHTQIWLFAIGVVAAILLNLDALTVMHRLDSDATLRDAWVAQADNLTEMPAAPAITAQRGAAGTAGMNPTVPATIAVLRQDLDSLGAPIGWGFVGTGENAAWRPLPQNCPALGAGGSCTAAPWPILGAYWLPYHAWWATLFGWLITGIAVTFGAPFWFDVLNKFTVIRSTVKPHEKSREEGSKDPGGNTGTSSPLITAFAAGRAPDGEDAAAAPAAPPSPPDLAPDEVGFQPEEWATPNPREIAL